MTRASKPARIALALLAPVLALAVSCTREHAPAPLAQPALQGGDVDFVAAAPTILDRLQSATTSVRHGGLRKLEFHYSLAGMPRTLMYEERVTCDGQGHFAIEPARVGAPPMTEAQREVFQLVQKNREGFFFRYRDFGIRELALFHHNYRVVDLKTSPIVCGRSCVELEIERMAGARSVYRLAVDRETALVLRCIETAPDGTLLARTEFTEFTLTPALDGVEWFVPNHESAPAGHESFTIGAFHFPAVAPRLVPPGYQLLRSEIIRESDTPWIRRVYGDGVENLFFLQRGLRSDSGIESDTAPGPVKGGSLTGEADVPRPPPGAHATEPYAIRAFTAGPWTLAEVNHGSEQYFAVGKLAEDEILRVVQSAF